MPGSGSNTQVTVAVDQVSSTDALPGRWDPEIVTGVPARPWSGVTSRIPMVGLGWAKAATVPGTGATPGTAGAGKGVVAAPAVPGMDKQAATRAVATSETLRILARLVTASPSGGDDRQI